MRNKEYISNEDTGFILGISAFYHDSSATILYNGKIIGAVQEERFTRIKGDNSFPLNSINYLLKEGNIDVKDLTAVVYYESPAVKYERLLTTSLLGDLNSLPYFLKINKTYLPDKLWIERLIKDTLKTKCPIFLLDHHLSHASSAYYPSQFKDSFVLTLDGVGEWSTTTIMEGRDKILTPLEEIKFPNSLGLLYSTFTTYAGFKVNTGEYKLMGLAPYGKPIYQDLILEKIISLNNDGSFALNPEYFDYLNKERMYSDSFISLFKERPRTPEEKLREFDANLASSIQEVLNLAVLNLLEKKRDLIKSDNLSLAGGVALNVVTVGEIERRKLFKEIYIQPSSGDAGGSLGSALYLHHNIKDFKVKVKKRKREIDVKEEGNKFDFMQGSYLGPHPYSSEEEIKNILQSYQITTNPKNEDEIISELVKEIIEGRVIALGRGRSEFGPRALGNRSVIASPKFPDMQRRLNLKTKFREGFRPFAPILLEEDLDLYFIKQSSNSPYMLKTFLLKDEYRKIEENENYINPFDRVNQIRSPWPAITHIDYSSRVQSINKEHNPFLYKLLKKYKQIQGDSILINTSFNVRGEPIVNEATDILECFLSTDIDTLLLGDRLIKKENLDLTLTKPKNRREFTND